MKQGVQAGAAADCRKRASDLLVSRIVRFASQGRRRGEIPFFKIEVIMETYLRGAYAD
jgi:hypothetical protein